ncbi:MAG TPA: ribonuclease III [Verrucomicrobiota bacterium]|nr:ribonuclease III [Verrucomicrobiota bacterium]
MSVNLEIFQDTIGYKIKAMELFQLALTHPSSCQTPNSVENNQRLEFLGDAVLGLIMALELYNNFPEMDEGELTKARARYVNGYVLACCARKINLGKYLILSPAEEQNGGRDRESTLADAFEALIGAIFLDGGFDVAREFVLNCFEKAAVEFKKIYIDNPKGQLQEILQATSHEPPQYKVIKSSGPDHAKRFECAVFHQGKQLGYGIGGSKKAAEVNAAMAALDTIDKTQTQNNKTDDKMSESTISKPK